MEGKKTTNLTPMDREGLRLIEPFIPVWSDSSPRHRYSHKQTPSSLLEPSQS